MSLLLTPSTANVPGMYEGAQLSLTNEAVEFSQPTPSCCVLAKTKRTVRLENITDVTLEDDCCLRMFGLQKMVLQTAGTGGVGEGGMNVTGVQASFLMDPEGWKQAINHATRLQKTMAAPGGQDMTRGAVPRTAKTQKTKLDRIAELRRLEVVDDAQANALRSGLLLLDEEYALKLLGMHDLVRNGDLDRAVLAEAVSNVVRRCNQV